MDGVRRFIAPITFEKNRREHQHIAFTKTLRHGIPTNRLLELRDMIVR